MTGGKSASVANEKGNQITSLISAVLIGYAITLIIFLGYSTLITYTAVSEERLPVVVAAATLISVIVAGFDAARGASTKGWLWGIAAGFIYATILLLLMTVVLQGFYYDSRTITLVVLSLAGGGLGGVVGINFRR